MGLQAYLITLAKHGPEMLLETAEDDPTMDEADVLKLEQAILVKEREKTYSKGRWKDDATKSILCLCGCGKRSPSARSHRLGPGQGRPAIYFDDNCKQRAYRKRRRDERERQRQETFERYQAQAANRRFGTR